MALVMSCIAYNRSRVQVLMIITAKNQMIGFGDCKNSIYLLRTNLKRMGYFEHDSCLPLRDFEEDKFRQDNDSNANRNNNRVLLQILHFLLLDYCTHIYKELLDIVPSLKLKNDQEFVDSAISIARDYFHLNPALTSQQYLSGGYLNKKLQFMANLTKAVHNKAEAIKKTKNKEGKKEIWRDAPQQLAEPESAEYRWTTGSNKIEDSDEEVPLRIMAAPMKIDLSEIGLQSNDNKKSQLLQGTSGLNQRQVLKKQRNRNIGKQFVVGGETFDEQQIKEALEERHPTPIHTAHKKQKVHMDPNQITNFEPKSDHLKAESKYAKYQLDEEKNKIRSLQGPSRHAKHNKNNEQERCREIASDGFVRKQDFNELVQLIKVLSGTVNEISAKFGDLESSVSAHINNLNARVLMIESSVRLLKDNL